MHDTKYNRQFLKPTKVENLKLSHFYLGCSITILSRTLRVIDFGDVFTRKALGMDSERCLVFIRPDAVCRAGDVLTGLELKKFRLVNLKLLYPTSEAIMNLFGGSIDYTKLPHLFSELTEKAMIAVEVMRTDSCSFMWDLIAGGKQVDPDATFVSNAELFLFAKNTELASKQADKIFGNTTGSQFRGQPRLRNTTLGIIKPHAVAEGATGRIWTALRDAGCCITAARLYRLSKSDAMEFLEVYKGVSPEYAEMVDHLASGPCIALEIAMEKLPDDGNVQHAFRELVGPMDPEIARFLRPNTLRAKFGLDKVQNALHCTDLPEDAELEVNFFFRLLDK